MTLHVPDIHEETVLSFDRRPVIGDTVAGLGKVYQVLGHVIRIRVGDDVKRYVYCVKGEILR